jgi:hypothetical protein
VSACLCDNSQHLQKRQDTESAHTCRPLPSLIIPSCLCAQGDELVTRVRMPMPLEDLHTEQPDVFSQLEAAVQDIERHYKDAQVMRAGAPTWPALAVMIISE